MTTNKPEVVAYLHSDKENPEHRGVSLHHDASCTSTLINTEPLIRLSDYEDMQTKCFALVEALELISDTDPDEGTTWFHEIANKALATYHNQGDNIQ